MKAIYRNISILITLLFIPLCVWAQQGGNRLVVPNVKLTHGGTATIPVEMYNNSNIVAAQFTLTLPEGIRVDIDNCSLTERATDHQLSIRETSNQNWTFIVNSGSNDAIRGTQGKLLSVSVSVGQEIEEGSTLSMQISDAVMSLKTGENVLTSATAGTITVQKMPNLVISDFRIDQSSIQPGETLQMSWNVRNTGELSATSGWCEHISFENNEASRTIVAFIPISTSIDEHEYEAVYDHLACYIEELRVIFLAAPLIKCMPNTEIEVKSRALFYLELARTYQSNMDIIYSLDWFDIKKLWEKSSRFFFSPIIVADTITMLLEHISNHIEPFISKNNIGCVVYLDVPTDAAANYSEIMDFVWDMRQNGIVLLLGVNAINGQQFLANITIMEAHYEQGMAIH